MYEIEGKKEHQNQKIEEFRDQEIERLEEQALRRLEKERDKELDMASTCRATLRSQISRIREALFCTAQTGIKLEFS